MRNILLAVGVTVLIGAVLASPVALAQPGCTSASDSCPVEIAVDETGITEVSLLNFTVGDWHTLSISNDDTKDVGGNLGQTHTVRMSGYGVSVTLEPLTVEEVVVEFDTVGCFEIKDMPTGDVVMIRVVTADSIDFEQQVAPDADPCASGSTTNPNGGGSASDAKKGLPGIDLVALVAGIVGVAFASRRLVQKP